MNGLDDVQHRIRELAREKDVYILAHNYQIPEVQQVADTVGDSLVLAKKAVEASQKTILLCGVYFMAETAAILNPSKTVLIPDIEAKCPMAMMVDAESVRLMRDMYPGAPVVAYVNTTAEVKAEADVCCTSANAIDVVKRLSEEEVIMVPDCNLAMYVQRFFPEKKIIPSAGYCPTHQAGITPEDIAEMKEKHPEAEVIVHPECVPSVIDMADGVYSTEGMSRHVAGSSSREFIIGTEKEHAYRLSVLFPEKIFHSLPSAVCPNMKKITLSKVINSLETMQFPVRVPSDISERAKHALDAMLETGRSR